MGKKYDDFPQVSILRINSQFNMSLFNQAFGAWIKINGKILFFFFLSQAMKAFIEANFKMIDLSGDGIVNAKEYRYNCITRIAVDSIQIVDDAFNALLDVSILLL